MKFLHRLSGLPRLVVCLGGLAVSAASSQGQLSLPQWTAEEWERLQSEAPDLGGSLFPQTDYSPEQFVPEPDAVPEEVPKTPEAVSLEVTTDLPEDLVELYFPEKLEARVLDPQSLLTQARLDGVLNFMDYHFREARSAIHIMLLKPSQRIPGNLDLQAIHKEWFGDSLSVLVIYNFGNPGMSRLIFGSEAETRVSEARRLHACFSAINEAVAVANAEDQLERFLTELSRRLYRIENIFHGTAPEHETDASPGVAAVPEITGGPLISGKHFWFTIFSITGVLMVTGSSIVALQKRAANKAFYFPERRRFSRLGCPCGGGNRLVVPFGKAKEPSPLGNRERLIGGTGSSGLHRQES